MLFQSYAVSQCDSELLSLVVCVPYSWHCLDNSVSHWCISEIVCCCILYWLIVSNITDADINRMVEFHHFVLIRTACDNWQRTVYIQVDKISSDNRYWFKYWILSGSIVAFYDVLIMWYNLLLQQTVVMPVEREHMYSWHWKELYFPQITRKNCKSTKNTQKSGVLRNTARLTKWYDWTSSRLLWSSCFTMSQEGVLNGFWKNSHNGNFLKLV